jgi:hypothetical protein
MEKAEIDLAIQMSLAAREEEAKMAVNIWLKKFLKILTVIFISCNFL